MALNDTQIALLRHAVADEAGEVEIELPEDAAEARAVVDELVALGYMQAVPGPEPRQRLDGASRPPQGQRMTLRITAQGRDAFGLAGDGER